MTQGQPIHLDTSACIAIWFEEDGEAAACILEWIAKLQEESPGPIRLSAASVAELAHGHTSRPWAPRKLRVVDVTSDVAELAGYMRAYAHGIGQLTRELRYDALIIATAWADGARCVLTKNHRDFELLTAVLPRDGDDGAVLQAAGSDSGAARRLSEIASAGRALATKLRRGLPLDFEIVGREYPKGRTLPLLGRADIPEPEPPAAPPSVTHPSESPRKADPPQLAAPPTRAAPPEEPA